MGKKINKFFKKPMSKGEAQERIEKMELEKGDVKAMIIAAFLVFTPVLLVVIGVVIGILYLIF